MKNLLSLAARAAAQVRDADSVRTCIHAAAAFIDVLATVPDEAAGALSAGDTRTLERLAEEVIDSIEARIARTSREKDAQTLASEVYEIRRQLEEVNRWRRHYAQMRSV